MTLSLSRRLFEWFGVLIPPHECELCGGRHWTYHAAVGCFWRYWAGVAEDMEDVV